jgi:hypothetical protein
MDRHASKPDEAEPSLPYAEHRRRCIIETLDSVCRNRRWGAHLTITNKHGDIEEVSTRNSALVEGDFTYHGDPPDPVRWVVVDSVPGAVEPKSVE